MFSGIVSALGQITKVEDDGGRRFWIESNLDLKDLALGASVCHQGCCLTIESAEQVTNQRTSHVVFASNQTLSLTTLVDWGVGHSINLEPSLRMGDDNGGHFVFGHVDQTGTVTAIEKDGAGWIFRFGMPLALAPMVASKGSVCVDGMSLTAINVTDASFEVAVIPHTYEVTSLKDRKVGDRVNLEADMLARYVSRQLSFLKA